MRRRMMKSKIHRATVTGANLNYVGSISLDTELMALADILPRLKKRLDDIPEPFWRARYLTNVPANARVIALAKAWLGEEAVRVLGL